ncbi:hypothetical protein Patl1_01271 [Pistacia atlantica]|uniref:Uncharacterized protein n=1 Tax=Pistacia atlantica TaxID=434234 RepID=A0ACC1CAR2_9ROSI|nr:hypothetical protein Patl1_01271 [Pistacia atlantica]
MKCAAYLDSAKQIAAQLGAVGKTIDDDDLIAYIVSGLTHSYHPFVTSLSFATRDKALSFEDFQADGANQHITANLEQLTLAAPYRTEHVLVGNGQVYFDLSLSNNGFDLSLNTNANSSTFHNSLDRTPLSSSYDFVAPTSSSSPDISPSPPHSLPAPIIPLASQRSHPMTTRSQTGHLKPSTFPEYKTFYSTKHPLKALTSITMPIEPRSYKQASLSPEWCTAMQEEYDALIENRTWILCPRPLNHNVIDNKWVYKVKQKSDGQVDLQHLQQPYQLQQLDSILNSASAYLVLDIILDFKCILSL